MLARLLVLGSVFRMSMLKVNGCIRVLQTPPAGGPAWS